MSGVGRGAHAGRLPRRPRRSGRARTRLAAAVLLGSTVALVACGDDATPQEAFCTQAREFIEYQGGLGVAVFVPAEAEAFFAGSVERITELAEIAPPTVEDEVPIVRDALIGLDEDLAAVDYNVSALSDEQLDTSGSDAASDAIDEFLATACRREGDPFSGFADDPFAPLVLSPAEIDALEEQVEGRDDELEQIVVTQLVDAFGLTGGQAMCLVDGLGMSFITSFTGGDQVTDADTARFLDQLDACGVDLEAITG